MIGEAAGERPLGRRAAKTAARRQAVLDAALRCFTSHGYNATTIADIGRTSGTSTGSIYHHFDDKAGIAVALYVELLETYQRSVLRALEQADDAHAGVRAGVLHYLDWICDHRQEASFLIDGPPGEVADHAASDLAPANARFLETLQRWLDTHADDGRLRRLPRRIAVAVWIAPSQEFVRHWLRTDGTAEHLREAREPLADAAWRALGPEDPPTRASETGHRRKP